MDFLIKKDDEREKRMREYMNNARQNGALAASNRQIVQVAGEIIEKLEQIKITACPCTTASVLAELSPEQIQASIVLLSRLAALDYLMPGNDESEFVRILHHALTRRDEIFADNVLVASEIIEVKDEA